MFEGCPVLYGCAPSPSKLGRILGNCYCFGTNHSVTLVALVCILHGVNGLDEVTQGDYK